MRAEILRRDAARDREHLAFRDRGLERGGDLVRVELLSVEIALHQAFVRLDDGVEELLAVLGDDVRHVGGDLDRVALLLPLGRHVRAHVQHVDDAGELVLDADRDVHCDALRRELRAERLEGAEEVGALAVEHVHEDEPCEPELLAEAPCARCPDLDAHHARDGHEHPVDDARRGAQLALESRVAGDVEQVDLPLLPRHVRERHRDRELAAVLVLVGVGDCRPRLDAAEAVDRAGLEEERLDERRLSRPAVSDDGDVTDLGGLGHVLALLLGAGFEPKA